MIWNNLKMALLSLKNAKLRSFLTMLGVIIGVAAVTSVVAIGQGVKQSVAGEVNTIGTNLLQVNPGQQFTEGEGGQSGGFNPTAGLGASTLTDKDIQTIQAIDDIEAAAPFSFISGVARAGNQEDPGAFLMATTPDMGRVLNLKYASGGFFEAANGRDVVIGAGTAEKLFGSSSALGKKLTVRGDEYTVVGVLAKPAQESLFSGGGTDRAIFLPYETAKAYSGGASNIIEIDAKVRSAERVDEAKQAIKDRLRDNHGGETDFTVMTQEEQLKVFDSILAILTTFIAAIAAISLLVGGVGIMNIMLVSVTERTREIGLRKALGATSTTVLMQFLIEALVLTLLGGLLGVLAAYGQGLVVSKVAKITPVFTLPVILMAVGISVAVGLIFGMMPAVKAARKRPIDALRYE